MSLIVLGQGSLDKLRTSRLSHFQQYWFCADVSKTECLCVCWSEFLRWGGSVCVCLAGWRRKVTFRSSTPVWHFIKSVFDKLLYWPVIILAIDLPKHTHTGLFLFGHNACTHTPHPRFGLDSRNWVDVQTCDCCSVASGMKIDATAHGSCCSDEQWNNCVCVWRTKSLL